MAIEKGTSLGPYEILSLIGAGGMGEVWRARDNRIGRDVAVKVLPESFAKGDERVWRFEQEARAAGALNHPGLITIFDVGTMDGSPYIVMELLEGKNLREVVGEAVPGTPIPVRKAIDYAWQIASALAVAHEKGIIHRDLKPENVFITSDRRVKILDFGLAKLAGEAPDADASRKTARHLTSAGIAVGTPGYMSPEQVRAQAIIDHRTDIFSFGSVLYEMLTGSPAFDCFSAIETMHAVMNVEPPPMSNLVPNIPPALETIVRHCLEKDPRERFQSARDLAFQLQTLSEGQTSITATRLLPAVMKRRPSRAAIATAAAVLAFAVGGFTLFRYRGGAGEQQPRTFQQLTYSDRLEIFPTLAPDGKSFAFVSDAAGNRDIYTQVTSGRIATNITSDSPAHDSEPAFSPDGSQIAFRSERDGGGIYTMRVTGESALRLTDFGHNPSWSPDGRRIVVSTAATDLRPHVHPSNGNLWIVDVPSGAKRALFQTGPEGAPLGAASDALQPSWSPNGHRIAYWGISEAAQRHIWTIDPDAPDPKSTAVRVTSDPALHWNPVWSPDGRYLYYGSNRDGTLNLWRVAIDEETGKPAGTPEPLSLPASINGNFAFSRQGELAFTTVLRSYRLMALPFDASSGTTGEPQPLFGGAEEILTFEPSPDRRSIAFTTAGAQEDLFVANADGTRMRQLTNDPARDRGVTWSPDGKTLYFYSNRDGSYHIWSIRADGSNLARVTDPADLARLGTPNIVLPSVSPDGRTLATDRPAALVHLDRPIARRLEAIPNGITSPEWSPDGTQLVGGPVDGRGIAVYSLQSKQAETVLDRGASAQWLPDSRRIAFFETANIGLLDLRSRQVVTAAFPPLPGVDIGNRIVGPRLSRDGSTLYVRQILEHGDIWMVRFEKE